AVQGTEDVLHPELGIEPDGTDEVEHRDVPWAGGVGDGGGARAPLPRRTQVAGTSRIRVGQGAWSGFVPPPRARKRLTMISVFASSTSPLRQASSSASMCLPGS